MKSLLFVVSVITVVLFAAGAQGVFIESPYVRFIQFGLGTSIVAAIALFLMLLDLDYKPQAEQKHH